MKQERETALAAALWAFIEQVRERDRAIARGLDGLTPAELEEMAALLRTAADVPGALETRESPRPEAAERRVNAAIAARGSEPAPWSALRRLPGWSELGSASRGWATATGLALTLGVGFAAGRAVSPPIAPPRSPGRAAETIAQISCREARARFATFVDERCTKEAAREVRAHLTRCGSCFHAYEEHRSRHKRERHAVIPAGENRSRGA